MCTAQATLQVEAGSAPSAEAQAGPRGDPDDRREEDEAALPGRSRDGIDRRGTRGVRSAASALIKHRVPLERFKMHASMVKHLLL